MSSPEEFQKMLDPEDFQSCVERGLYLLKLRKKQLESEGYKTIRCLKSARWAIEQRIINRKRDTPMMPAVIEYVEMIEEYELIYNGIFSN